MGQSIRVIDSHTEGEPTRVVVEGGPPLRGGSLAERVTELATHHDTFRTGVVCEPRGSDAVVGALLTPPCDRAADFGVIFFNNVGYLGMCGHGTIGLVRTLQHLGKLLPGRVNIETPVGIVQAVLHGDDSVSVLNVPSYRYRTGVTLEVESYGRVTGDVAYGGNWFFLADAGSHRLTLDNLRDLTDFTCAIRRRLEELGIRGAEGATIDHIEIFGPPARSDADSKNFVLCPGLAYDRSPCGTGLSAKLACLAADEKLAPGDAWRQESIIGSLFEGRYHPDGDCVRPQITGRAYVTADATLIFEEADPLSQGIRA